MLFLSREILSLSLEKVLFLVLCVQLCKGVLLVEVQGMQQAAVMISFLLTVKKLCLEMLMLTSLSYQPCLLKSSNISKGLKYPVWTLCILVHCVYLYGFCCKLFFCSFQNIISTGQPGVLSSPMSCDSDCSPVWPMTGRADGGSRAGGRWGEADSQEQPGGVPTPAYIVSCCVTWAPEQRVGEGRELRVKSSEEQQASGLEKGLLQQLVKKFEIYGIN